MADISKVIITPSRGTTYLILLFVYILCLLGLVISLVSLGHTGSFTFNLETKMIVYAGCAGGAGGFIYSMFHLIHDKKNEYSRIELVCRIYSRYLCQD